MPISNIAPLLTKGHLFLALSQSVEIPQTSQHLWFSKPEVIEAHIVSGKTILKAKKLGRVFAHGLVPGSGLSTLDVVSAKDYPLLNGCAQAFASVVTWPPQFSLSPREADQQLNRCPLSEISAPQNDSNGEWKAFDQETEKRLLESGLRFQRQENESLLPSFVMEQNQILSAKKFLGPRSAFYQWVGKVATSQPGRTLLFDIGLVEISSSQLQSLGLKIPTELKFKSLRPEVALDPTLLRDLGISLSSFEGLGKILSQPRLRVRPGDKAHFQSGGEIPIKSSSAQSSSVSWKPHGLILDIEPHKNVETGASSISVHFQIELSEPDFSTAIDGIPSMRSRRLNSSFDLRTNETTVLGALTQTRDSSSKEGPWGLEWIPLLSSIFRHSSNVQQNSELWFVVKPSWEEIPLARFSQLESKKGHL